MSKAENKLKAKDGAGSFTILKRNSKIFKTIIGTLSGIIDETEVIVTPEKFIIKAMDPSRISLLKLTVKNTDFDEYLCDVSTKVAFNLGDMEKIFKRASSDDEIELNYEKHNNKIRIKMTREGSTKTRTFTLALLDLDMEEIPMENLLAIEYPSSWVIDADFLVEALKDAEIYSEIIEMKAEELNGLIMQSSGQIGEMTYQLGFDDLMSYDLNGSSTGAYSIVFLKSVLKIASITEKLEVSLKTDHPIKMQFDLLEGGELIQFIAPRVEDTEFEDEDMEEF